MSGERSRSQDVGSLEARYANYFQVGYNAFEVLIDFGQFYREAANPGLHTRIITSPVYAKALASTLQDSLDRYERAHGPIPTATEESPES